MIGHSGEMVGVSVGHSDKMIDVSVAHSGKWNVYLQVILVKWE